MALAEIGGPIPKALRQRLSDPNCRDSGSTQRGLRVVKEIVRSQGGRIELTSDDVATVFHLRFPKAHNDNEPHEGEADGAV